MSFLMAVEAIAISMIVIAKIDVYGTDYGIEE